MKEMSLYIHIPFCKQKCLYCDFPSYAGKENLMDEYISALNKEILNKGMDYIITSIFIGGGTPSYLDEKNLERLLKTINKLNLKDDIEFTVECNPGTINEEKLLIMKKNNVNRLSMGLQSTNNNLLKEIGRIHTFEEFKKNYMEARKIGFKNINIDLMFGLPGQSVEEWKNTLEDAINLMPDHISAYSLIIEEGTCFYKLYNDDKLNLPSEDEERKMYLLAKELLKNHGYHQYEISNYAKDNKECFHNKVYWQCNEYLGLGASASSFVNEKRFKNIDDIKKYIEKINKVKDLASVFRTRIELRQIGVRDETKILGGIGICGRELCCKSYLSDFIPVSIKMAKEQNLSLNPTKISGVCGRLMCCLKNEQDTYEYLNSRLPSVGDTVTTPSGMRGEVSAVNVLRQLVKVVVDNGEEKELQEYRVDDLRFTPRRRKDVKLTEEELKELEGLEDNGEVTEEKPEHQNRENRGGNRGRGNRRNNGERDNAGEDNRSEGRENNRRDRGRGRRNNDNRKNNEAGENHSEQSGSNDSQS